MPASLTATPTRRADASEAAPSASEDDWPVHRPLIRATLPRPEGQVPERKEPDFTIRQPGGRFDGAATTANRSPRASGRRQRQGSAAGQAARFGGSRSGLRARGTASGTGSAQGESASGRHRAAPAAAVVRAAGDAAAATAGPGRGQGATEAQASRTTSVGLMTDFAGKHGLIVGVANKRSIAWAIAQATARRGARLALTYQGRFEEHVNELSQGLEQPPLVLPCDVSSDADIDAVFAKIDQEFGGLDFVVHGAAFAPREELSAPFSKTTREGFRMAIDISAYSLIALTRGALPLMEKRGGGSILTLTYLGSERVFPNYNVMGVAKAALEATVRYLAADVGPKNIRVNAVSAGPIKTLAAAGISGFSNILHVYRERAPLRRNVETSKSPKPLRSC